VTDCETLRIRLRLRRHSPGIPQPTEWQRIGNEIDAAMIFARANSVSVHFFAKQNRGCRVETAWQQTAGTRNKSKLKR
jgi:hypothetical protein